MVGTGGEWLLPLQEERPPGPGSIILSYYLFIYLFIIFTLFSFFQIPIPIIRVPSTVKVLVKSHTVI